MQLRARAAGAGAVLPEIIRLAHSLNVRRIEADLLRPDVICLIVLLIDRHMDSLRRHADYLREEFPRPGDRLALEIIAEGEIAQHLKKGAVARGFAHILDIRRAHALLTGGHAAARRGDLSGKILLHWRHARIDEQKALIPLRDERKAWQPQMPLALKKAEILLPQVV